MEQDAQFHPPCSIGTVLEGMRSREASTHVTSTRTFLHVMVWLDADPTSRGQSSDSSVLSRVVERRRASDPLSLFVAWQTGERSIRRHHTSPSNI